MSVRSLFAEILLEHPEPLVITGTVEQVSELLKRYQAVGVERGDAREAAARSPRHGGAGRGARAVSPRLVPDNRRSSAVNMWDSARSRIQGERRNIPCLGVVLARPGRDLNMARCRFCTVGGRKRNRLISGWFGLGSGLELLSSRWSPDTMTSGTPSELHSCRFP